MRWLHLEGLACRHSVHQCHLQTFFADPATAGRLAAIREECGLGWRGWGEPCRHTGAIWAVRGSLQAAGQHAPAWPLAPRCISSGPGLLPETLPFPFALQTPPSGALGTRDTRTSSSPCLFQASLSEGTAFHQLRPERAVPSLKRTSPLSPCPWPQPRPWPASCLFSSAATFLKRGVHAPYLTLLPFVRQHIPFCLLLSRHCYTKECACLLSRSLPEKSSLLSHLVLLVPFAVATLFCPFHSSRLTWSFILAYVSPPDL